MDARGKFGEHERSVRVARGAGESNSSFLSALQTSQVHPTSFPGSFPGLGAPSQEKDPGNEVEVHP